MNTLTSEFFGALESAGWPALLVENTGAIRHANAAAVSAFGATVSGETALLSAIWAPDNAHKAEQFLARWEQTPTPAAGLKFLLKGGATAEFLCAISLASYDQQKYFLIQLLPAAPPVPNAAAAAPTAPSSPAPRPTAPAPSPQTVESGVALKQKLDCALQLTRTVALDFNNTLTGILGHASLVLSKIEPGNPWRSSLVEIEKAAEKAAEIAYDLAAFSWQEKPAASQKAGNLNELLTETSELFQSSGTNVMWALQFEPRLYSANFDGPKMQQVFIKILDNAVEAIAAEGRVIVRTRNLDLAEPLQDVSAKLPAGRYICAEIVDTGGGITPENLPRIFEPFFTTKQAPKHRGLGLAWVYGIATNHNGFVAVSSSVGQGTSVRVYLPALQKFVRGASGAGKDEDLTGDKTVLIVDDEDLLLTMGQMVLSAYGYRVFTANNGQKALEWLQRSEPRIDLLITDLVMPGMTGKELIDHTRRVAPEVKIIYTSGYTQPGHNERKAFLPKPFSSQDLLRKVKDVFGGGEAN
ncbi:MAG TPA: ATP-binding protein [Verrucomicrobiae bacterium]